jgi:endoglucanase
MYAGAAARAAYVLRPIKPQLASTYEESALRAMRWAEAEYEKWTRGPDYSKVVERVKTTVAAERNLAALELYRLTRDKRWDEVFRATTDLDKPGQPPRRLDAAFIYARLDDSLVDPSMKRSAREAVLGRANEEVRQGKGNAFGVTTADRAINNGALTLPASQEIVRAHVLTGDPVYLQSLLRSALYSAGANPMNMTMTTGVGHDWPRNLLHEDSRHFGQPAPTGLTIYGPIDLERYRQTPGTWPIGKLQTQCTPPALEWPTTEAYFDIYAWAPMNEYTVMQNLGPTAYVWGYLAARK